MENYELTFDTPETGRKLPISGIPFKEMMEAMWNESEWNGRLVR